MNKYYDQYSNPWKESESILDDPFTPDMKVEFIDDNGISKTVIIYTLHCQNSREIVFTDKEDFTWNIANTIFNSYK
ncbi:MAG TPA: hypothetical protein VNF93_02390 [Buchnera sp. (in: enterobacteria)]|nr:hypothetical protein [Buchnera sp. (in: enterobacteria)]